MLKEENNLVISEGGVVTEDWECQVNIVYKYFFILK